MPDIQRYRGLWHIFGDGKQYEGELIIDTEKKTIKLETIVQGGIGDQSPKLYHGGKIKYITGTLFDNNTMLLYQCSIYLRSQHFGITHQYVEYIVYAENCFSGLLIQDREEPRFTEITLRLGDIVHWSGLCEYDTKRDDQGTPQIIWNSKEPVSFALREDTEIVFSPSLSKARVGSTRKQLILEQHISIILKYKNGAIWDKIKEDINNIKYFIEFGIGSLMGIESISYLHRINVETDDDTKQIFIPQVDSVWLGDRDDTRIYEEEEMFYTFTLSECVEYNLFTNWIKICEKLEPILDLYFAAYRYNAFVPETVFLNLMQALETYHARFISDDICSFLRHVDMEVNDYCGDNGNVEEWKKHIANDGQRKPECRTIYLRSRLADLFFAEGNLAHVSYWGGNQKEFVEKLVDTRNYYTHYNVAKKDKAFTKDELPFINRILYSFLTFHILTKMGYDTEKARVKAMQDIHNVYFAHNESVRYSNDES